MSELAVKTPSMRRRARRSRRNKQMQSIDASVRKVNLSDNDGILKYCSKFVNNENVFTPRPIPSPTSVFTLSRTFNFSAPMGDALNLVFIAQPDIYEPYNYFNIHGVSSTTSVLLEFLNSSTMLLPGESYATGSRDIRIMFPIVPNNPAITRVQSVFKVAQLSTICVAPDYRDPETLLIQDGAVPYFNFSAATGASIINIGFVVQGATSGTVTCDYLFYDQKDLKGNLTTQPMIVTASNANLYNVSLAAFPVPVGTQSFSISLQGFARLDAISLSAGFNLVAFHLDNYDSGILNPVNPTDEASWLTTVQAADAWAVTGLHVTATNTTAQGFTGGRVGMALIPLSYAIPSDYTDCINFISSRRHYKYVGAVIDGAHGVWSPRDLRETLHQPTYARMYSNRIVVACNIPSSGAAAASVQIQVSLRLELLTNSQTIASYLPPSSSVALDALFAAIRDNLNYAFGENPKHVERLKQIAKDVATNPAVVSTMKQLGKAGLTTLLGLLAV